MKRQAHRIENWWTSKLTKWQERGTASGRNKALSCFFINLLNFLWRKQILGCKVYLVFIWVVEKMSSWRNDIAHKLWCLWVILQDLKTVRAVRVGMAGLADFNRWQKWESWRFWRLSHLRDTELEKLFPLPTPINFLILSSISQSND